MFKFVSVCSRVAIGDDFFHIVAEPIQISVHIGFKLGWIAQQRFQGSFRGVVEYRSRRLTQAHWVRFNQTDVFRLRTGISPRRALIASWAPTGNPADAGQHQMTSRYLPRTNTSLRQSSAMDHMKLTILLWDV